MTVTVERVATLFQAAALGHESLHVCVLAVCKLLDAEAAVMWAPGATEFGRLPWVSHQISDEFVGQYMADFALRGRDPQMNELLSRKAFHPVHLDVELIDRRSFKRTELYNDLFRRTGLYESLLGLSNPDLTSHGIPRMQLTIARGPHKDFFDKGDKKILEALSPHFDTAMLLFAERRARANASIAAAFDQAADAIAVLDGEGKVQYSNPAFDSFRRELDPDNRYLRTSPLNIPALIKLKCSFDSVLREQRSIGVAAQRCAFATNEQTPRRFVGVVSSLLTSPGIAGVRPDHLYLVAIRASTAVVDERVSALKSRFRLTASEAGVLHLFAGGLGVEEIAAHLGVTVHTARAHMKALLQKTDCRRQSQLMKLLETVLTGKLRVSV